jgi:hypothetical protein
MMQACTCVLFENKLTQPTENRWRHMLRLGWSRACHITAMMLWSGVLQWPKELMCSEQCPAVVLRHKRGAKDSGMSPVACGALSVQPQPFAQTSWCRGFLQHLLLACIEHRQQSMCAILLTWPSTGFIAFVIIKQQLRSLHRCARQHTLLVLSTRLVAYLQVLLQQQLHAVLA